MKVGFRPYRLIETDPYHAKEVAFVKVFNKEMEYNKNFIHQIISSENGFYLSEREETIVLSVIQWLGTPVGQGFLEEVNKLTNKQAINAKTV